jgi:hypothetical protein
MGQGLHVAATVKRPEAGPRGCRALSQEALMAGEPARRREGEVSLSHLSSLWL